MTDTARTIIVTGSSSGMGLATAELFCDLGWTVIGIDITPTTVQSGSGTLIPVVADVRNRDALSAALDEALPTGDITAVANIAGVYPPTTLDDFDEERFRRIFDINVLGILNVAAAARPRMRAGSSIINLASVDAFTVSPGQLLYGASKAAVVMLTKSLALELAPSGIRVNGIAPGWVATPGNAATGRMDAAAASIPIGRVAQPAEIATWIRVLADEATAGFMTGETITLSGGDVMR